MTIYYCSDAILPPTEINSLTVRGSTIIAEKNVVVLDENENETETVKKPEIINSLDFSEPGEVSVINVLTSLKSIPIVSISSTGYLSLDTIGQLTASKDTLKKINGRAGYSSYYNSKNMTNVGHLKSLKDFTVLDSITCGGGLISDLLDGVSECTNFSSITYLSIKSNNLTDISELSSCTGLKELYCNSNSISDLTVLKYMKVLKTADFTNNTIEDLYPLNYLLENETLALKTLKLDTNLLEKYSINYAKDNYITSIDSLEHKRSNLETITALKNAGCNVTYTGNQL